MGCGCGLAMPAQVLARARVGDGRMHWRLGGGYGHHGCYFECCKCPINRRFGVAISAEKKELTGGSGSSTRHLGVTRSHAARSGRVLVQSRIEQRRGRIHRPCSGPALFCLLPPLCSCRPRLRVLTARSEPRADRRAPTIPPTMAAHPMQRYRDDVTGMSSSNQDFFDGTGLPVRVHKYISP